MSRNGIRVRKGWLIAGTILIPLFIVITGFLYYPALLQSGTLSSDADSIGIPIFTGILMSPVLALVLVLYAAPAIYRYDGSATLFTADRRFPWRLAGGILLYGLPALFLLFVEVRGWFTPMPTFERWWSLVSVPSVVWMLLLRAAVSVERGPTKIEGSY